MVCADDRDHELSLGMGKDESFLCEVVHLDLGLLGDVAVHAADPGVSRVDAVATGDLADGLRDLTEPLDALCNAAHRLFRRERVDLDLGARDIEVGQDQDIVQCNAVAPVRELKDVTEHQCVLGDLALDGCFHCFSTRDAVGYRTDTTDTGCDLGHLLGVLPTASFSTPLTGVMEHQLPVSMMPASLTFKTSLSVLHVLWLGKSLQLSTILSPHVMLSCSYCGTNLLKDLSSLEIIDRTSTFNSILVYRFYNLYDLIAER